MTTIKRLLIFWVAACALRANAQTPDYAEHGMVVSASQTASNVGRDILRKGGNAIDAAVATAFALAVTWPAAGNIGGGGFIVYRTQKGDVTTFDFREKAPLAATKNMFVDESGNLIRGLNHEGILAVAVPGTVAGLYSAHQKYGRLSWARLVQPAIRLARKGFPFSYALYDDSRQLASTWKRYPSTVRVMMKEDGSYYVPGEVWRQPDLAKTLKRIRVHGKSGFYEGQTAKRLASFVRSMGGLISEEDLATYEAIERPPVAGTYRGCEVYSMPPPSSGGITLIQMLNILEGFDLTKIGYNSADYVHILSEAMRRAYANRALYLGDDDFNPEMPVQRMISKSYANLIRASIRMDSSSASDSSSFSRTYEGPNTTHLSVLDNEGNAVAMTYTLEYSYGSQIIAAGLGFFLNNEMGDFNPVPQLTNSEGLIGTSPNLVAPGKRMLSSMTPTIITKDSRPYLLLGSPGGRTIINSVLQVVVNVVDHGMNVAEAIESKRFHHQWLPNRIIFEPHSLSSDVVEKLRERGHTLEERNGTQGAVMGILYDPTVHRISGHADLRAPDGGVAGY